MNPEILRYLLFDVDRPAWQQKQLLVLIDVVCYFWLGILLLLDSRGTFQPLEMFRSLCEGVSVFKEVVYSVCSQPLLGEMSIIPLVRAWFCLMQLWNTMHGLHVHVQVKESMGGKAGLGLVCSNCEI